MHEPYRDPAFERDRERAGEALVTHMTERDRLLRDLYEQAHFAIGHQCIVVRDIDGSLWRRLRAAVGAE